MCKLLAFVSLIGIAFCAPIESPTGSLGLSDVIDASKDSLGLDTALDHFSAISELKSNGLSLPSLDVKSSALSAPTLHLETASSPSDSSFNLKSTGLSSAGSVRTSHVIEASKDSLVDAVKLPVRVTAESKAIGGSITAAAGVKGSVVSSAIATPIIVKAVALPGLAATKTAGIMAIPHLLFQNIQTVPELVSNQLKTSIGSIANIGKFENFGHNLPELMVIEESDGLENLENEGSIAFDKEREQLSKVGQAVKNGALGLKAGALGLKAKTVGLAAKGFLVVKKGVYTAGRIIMKPIAIIAGAHLKMLGTGLTLGGKLIGGTGAAIAKAGTGIKYAGLGGIGVGASAISWGFDKSTIGSHNDLNASIGSHFSTRVDNTSDD